MYVFDLPSAHPRAHPDASPSLAPAVRTQSAAPNPFYAAFIAQGLDPTTGRPLQPIADLTKGASALPRERSTSEELSELNYTLFTCYEHLARICEAFPHMAQHVRKGDWAHFPRHLPEAGQIRAVHRRTQTLQCILSDLSLVLGTTPGTDVAPAHIRLGIPFHQPDRVPEPPRILQRADSPVRMVDRGISATPLRIRVRQARSSLRTRPTVEGAVNRRLRDVPAEASMRCLGVMNSSSPDIDPGSAVSSANVNGSAEGTRGGTFVETFGRDICIARNPSLTSDTNSSVTLPSFTAGTSDTAVHASGLTVPNNSSLAVTKVRPSPPSRLCSSPTDIRAPAVVRNGLASINGDSVAATVIGYTLASMALGSDSNGSSAELEEAVLTGSVGVPHCPAPVNQDHPPHAPSPATASEALGLGIHVQAFPSQTFEEVSEGEGQVQGLVSEVRVPDPVKTLHTLDCQEVGGAPAILQWTRQENLLGHTRCADTGHVHPLQGMHRRYISTGITPASPSESDTTISTEGEEVHKRLSALRAVRPNNAASKPKHRAKRMPNSSRPKDIPLFFQNIDALLDRRKDKKAKREADRNEKKRQAENKRREKKAGGSTASGSVVVCFRCHSSEHSGLCEFGEQCTDCDNSFSSTSNLIEGSWEGILVEEVGPVTEWEPKIGGEGSIRRLARKLRIEL